MLLTMAHDAGRCGRLADQCLSNGMRPRAAPRTTAGAVSGRRAATPCDRRREMLARVARPTSPARVCQRMQRDVASNGPPCWPCGMAIPPSIPGCRRQPARRAETVRVPLSKPCRRPWCLAVVVVPFDHATSAGALGDRTSSGEGCASCLASAAAARCAASILGKRKICGVCARHRPVRGTVPCHRPPNRRLLQRVRERHARTVSVDAGAQASINHEVDPRTRCGRVRMATGRVCAARIPPFPDRLLPAGPPRWRCQSIPSTAADRGPRLLRRQRPGRGRCPASPGTHPGCGAGRVGPPGWHIVWAGGLRSGYPGPRRRSGRCKLARPAR